MRQSHEDLPGAGKVQPVEKRVYSKSKSKSRAKQEAEDLESRLLTYNKLQVLGASKVFGALTRTLWRAKSESITKLKEKCKAEKRKKFGVMLIEGLFRQKRKQLKVGVMGRLKERSKNMDMIKRVSVVWARIERRCQQQRKREIFKRLKQFGQIKYQTQQSGEGKSRRKITRNREQSSVEGNFKQGVERFKAPMRETLLSILSYDQQLYNTNLKGWGTKIQSEINQYPKKTKRGNDSMTDNLLSLNCINNLITYHQQSMTKNEETNQLRIREEQMKKINQDLELLSYPPKVPNPTQYLTIQKSIFQTQGSQCEDIYKQYYRNLASLTFQLSSLNSTITAKDQQILTITQQLSDLKLRTKPQSPKSSKPPAPDPNSPIKEWQETIQSFLKKIENGDSTWLPQYNRKKKWLGGLRGNQHFNSMVRIDVELLNIISEKEKEENVRKNKSLSERDCRLSLSDNSFEEDRPLREKIKELSKENLILTHQLQGLKGKLNVIESESVPRTEISDLEEIIYNINEIMVSEEKEEPEYWYRLRLLFEKIQFNKLYSVVDCTISLIKLVEELLAVKAGMNTLIGSVNEEVGVMRENIRAFSSQLGRDLDLQLVGMMKKNVEEGIFRLELQRDTSGTSKLQDLRELYVEEAQSKLHLLEVLQRQCSLTKQFQGVQRGRLKQRHRSRSKKNKTSGDLQSAIRFYSDQESDVEGSRVKKLEFSKEILSAELGRYRSILDQYGKEEQIILQRIEDYEKQLGEEKEKSGQLELENSMLVISNQQLRSALDDKVEGESRVSEVKENNPMESKIVDLTNKLQIQTGIVQQLTATIRDTGSRMADLQSQNQELKLKNQQLEQKLADTHHHLLEKQREQKEHDHISHLKSMKTSSKIKDDSYKSEIEEEEIRPQLQDKEEEIIRLEDRIEQIERKNERLVGELQRTFIEKEINQKHYQSEIYELRQEIERGSPMQGRQRQDVEEDIEGVVAQRLHMQEEYYKTLLATSSTSYDCIISQHTKEIQRLNTQIQEHQTSMNQPRFLQFQIDKLKSKVHHLSQTKDQLNLKIKEQQQTIHQLEQRLGRHNDELELLRERLIEKMNANNLEKEGKRKEKRSIQELEKIIGEKEVLISAQNRQMEEIVVQEREWRESFEIQRDSTSNQLMEELQRYERKVGEMSQELEVISERYNIKSAEVNANNLRFQERERELVAKISMTEVVNQQISSRFQTLTEQYNSLRLLMDQDQNQERYLIAGIKSPILESNELEEGSEGSLRQKLKGFNLEDSIKSRKSRSDERGEGRVKRESSDEYEMGGEEIDVSQMKRSYRAISNQNKDLALEVEYLNQELINKEQVLLAMNEKWVSLQEQHRLLQQQLRTFSQRMVDSEVREVMDVNSQGGKEEILHMREQIQLLRSQNQHLSNQLQIYYSQPLRSGTHIQNHQQPNTNSHRSLHPVPQESTKKMLTSFINNKSIHPQPDQAEINFLNKVNEQMEQLTISNNILLVKLRKLENKTHEQESMKNQHHSNSLIMTTLQNMLYRLIAWVQETQITSIQSLDIPYHKLQNYIRTNNIDKYIRLLEQTLQVMIAQVLNNQEEALYLQATELAKVKEKLIEIIDSQIEEAETNNNDYEFSSFKSHQEENSVRIQSINRFRTIGGLLKQYSEIGDPTIIEKVHKLLYRPKSRYK